MINRRYGLRHVRTPLPSTRALWARVGFYVVILIGVLLLQQSIGDKAAGCLGVFGG